FLNRHARPDALEQLLFLDNPAGVFHKYEQRFEGLGTQRDKFTTPVQAARYRVHRKPAKAIQTPYLALNNRVGQSHVNVRFLVYITSFHALSQRFQPQTLDTAVESG